MSLSNSLSVKGLGEEHQTLAHDVPWARGPFPKDSSRSGPISNSYQMCDPGDDPKGAGTAVPTALSPSSLPFPQKDTGGKDTQPARLSGGGNEKTNDAVVTWAT